MGKKVGNVDSNNPFFVAMNDDTRPVRMRDLVTIACAFKIAGPQQSTDVWAALRMAHALEGYKGPGLYGYLEGSYFSAYVNDGHIAENDLEALRECAYEFLAYAESGLGTFPVTPAHFP